MMNKEYLSYFISILSLIVSGIAIAATLFRKESLSVDYIGVFAGILSLLVVFTVSWQIINAMEVKKELDKAVQERKMLNNEINNRLMSIVSNVCDYTGDIAEMVSKRDNAHWEYFITSIKFYNKYWLVGNMIMKDIAKSHVIKSLNMEQEKYGEVATDAFTKQLIDNLNFEDISNLKIDIERHIEKSKDDEILKNLLDVLIIGINNREEIRKKVEEQENKERQEQSEVKQENDSTSPEYTPKEDPKEDSYITE